MSNPVHRQLCAALTQLAGPAEIIRSHDRPWASITFSGARHWITMQVPAKQAATLAAELPEAEFSLPGQLVADLAITATRTQAEDAQIDIEALTVIYPDMDGAFSLAPPGVAAQRGR